MYIEDAVYKIRDASLFSFSTYFAPEDRDLTMLKPLIADLGDVDPFVAAD